MVLMIVFFRREVNEIESFWTHFHDVKKHSESVLECVIGWTKLQTINDIIQVLKGHVLVEKRKEKSKAKQPRQPNVLNVRGAHNPKQAIKTHII